MKKKALVPKLIIAILLWITCIGIIYEYVVTLNYKFPNPSTHVVILLGAISFGLVAIAMTLIVIAEYNWGPEELFEAETICILAPHYFKIVMETASVWGTIPYNTVDGKPCWYWQVFRKHRGYLMTGFKMNWPPQKNDLSGIELVDFLHASPIQTVFVTEKLYERIQIEKTYGGFAVELTHYGGVKTRHSNYGVIPEFAMFANKIERALPEKEVHCLKSVDAMAGGV